MSTRYDEESVEERLRTTFAGARDEVGIDLAGVAEASFARAGRIRRRRGLAQVVGVTGVVAATVAAVVVGTGALGGGAGTGRLEPAATSAHSATKGAAQDWSQYVSAAGTWAYRLPDVLPDPISSVIVLEVDNEIEP